MKKFALLLTTMLAATAIIAQPVRLAVKGAYNYASAKAVYSGIKQSTEAISGYGIGVMAKVPFDGVLNFSPSVMINRRGFIIKPSSGGNKKEQYGITYLDIIPSLSVDFPQGNNSFAIGIGPDFGFTNFGKLKATDNGNVTTSQKLKFGYSAYGWFDLGLNASVGYHTKKAFVELGYLMGLASVNNNEENDQRNIQNRVASLSVGFYFR